MSPEASTQLLSPMPAASPADAINLEPSEDTAMDLSTETVSMPLALGTPTNELSMDETPAESVAAPDEGASTAPAGAEETDAKPEAPATVEDPWPKDPATRHMYKEILKQVEYYFGDANLSRDDFLKDIIAKNADGWVPLRTMMDFNKLRALCKDKDEVAKAVKLSKSLMDVSPDGQSIRRVPKKPSGASVPIQRDQVPFKNNYDPRHARTIYVKGFPEDMTNVLDYCTDLFMPLGSYKNTMLRRDRTTNLFKGSVYVEFQKPEDAEAVSKMTLEYEGKPLMILMKAAYIEMKTKEYNGSFAPSRNGKGPMPSSFDNKPQDMDRSLLCLDNLGPLTLVEEVKEFLRDYKMRYIKYRSGEPNAYVIFGFAGGADQAVKRLLQQGRCTVVSSPPTSEGASSSPGVPEVVKPRATTFITVPTVAPRGTPANLISQPQRTPPGTPSTSSTSSTPKPPSQNVSSRPSTPSHENIKLSVDGLDGKFIIRRPNRQEEDEYFYRNPMNPGRFERNNNNFRAGGRGGSRPSDGGRGRGRGRGGRAPPDRDTRLNANITPGYHVAPPPAPYGKRKAEEAPNGAPPPVKVAKQD
ncbi:hypothetical protein HKX48_000048 [Thoreauomyces humboldtii]|nr:hypothetical protein HKX48_000048 [Thoreauomyces humboldtii]